MSQIIADLSSDPVIKYLESWEKDIELTLPLWPSNFLIKFPEFKSNIKADLSTELVATSLQSCEIDIDKILLDGQLDF